MNADSNNFTMIADLPDLDDVEASTRGNTIDHNNHANSQHILPEEHQGKYSKFIRNPHQPRQQSGMASAQPMYEQQINDSYYQPPEPQPEPIQETISYKMPNNTPSCLVVAEHIANCPICSKVYNDDKSIYIVSIVILVIICILLLKKVLDK